MKETCGNCGNFVKHYFKHRGEYIESGIGHCDYPFGSFISMHKEACLAFTYRLPVDDEIIRDWEKEKRFK